MCLIWIKIKKKKLESIHFKLKVATRYFFYGFDKKLPLFLIYESFRGDFLQRFYFYN